MSILISVLLCYVLGELGAPSFLGYSSMFTFFPLSFISILVSYGFLLFLFSLFVIAMIHARFAGKKLYA